MNVSTASRIILASPPHTSCMKCSSNFDGVNPVVRITIKIRSLTMLHIYGIEAASLYSFCQAALVPGEKTPAGLSGGFRPCCCVSLVACAVSVVRATRVYRSTLMLKKGWYYDDDVYDGDGAIGRVVDGWLVNAKPVQMRASACARSRSCKYEHSFVPHSRARVHAIRLRGSIVCVRLVLQVSIYVWCFIYICIYITEAHCRVCVVVVLLNWKLAMVSWFCHENCCVYVFHIGRTTSCTYYTNVCITFNAPNSFSVKSVHRSIVIIIATPQQSPQTRYTYREDIIFVEREHKLHAIPSIPSIPFMLR